MFVHRSAAFAILLALSACQQSTAPVENEVAAAADPRGVSREKAGQTAPDIELRDADDEPAALSDQNGEPLLVNIWATWCAPCVKELPTLAKLEQRHAVDGDLGIIVVSQDMTPKASVDSFLKAKGIALRSFLDPEMKLTGALGVEVMPTTLLYDSQGKEVWRYTGDLDWTGPEAAKLLAEAAVGAK